MGLEWTATASVSYEEEDIMNADNIGHVRDYFNTNYKIDIEEKRATNLFRFVMYEFLQKTCFNVYAQDSSGYSLDDITSDCFFYIFRDYMDRRNTETERLDEYTKESYLDGGECSIFDCGDGTSLTIWHDLYKRPNPEDEFDIQDLFE